MKKSRPLLLAVVVACSLWAQAPARIDVSAPEPRLVLGRRTQLTATARAADGSVLPSVTLTWSADASAVVAVDARGMVSSLKLGLATVTARAGSVSNSVEVQVLPLRVEVAPERLTIPAGERFQFTALAFDASEARIPAVSFAWQVVGVHGSGTASARINPDGLLITTSANLLTVRAVVTYPGRSGSFAPQVTGTALVEVTARREFRLASVLSTEQERNSFELRPSYTQMAANDAGQIAFVGSLDGLAAGLLLFQNGRIDLLSGAGRPGATPGATVNGFPTPAINSRGEVLANVFASGALGAGGLLLASGAGASWVLLANTSTGDLDNLSSFFITRFSLNDNSDILFRASYQPVGSTATRLGLFRLSGERVQLMWSAGRDLQGITSVTDFPEFGSDNQGLIHFIATDATARGLYRTDEATPPVKVLALGDAFADSTVTQLSHLSVSLNGPVAFRLALQNNTQQVVRVAGGQTQNLPVGGTVQVFSVNDSGGVVFNGNYRNQGQGLYRWQGEDVSLLLRSGATAPNGQAIRAFDSAHLTAAGDVFVQLRTTTNDLVVMRLGAPAPLLFQAGQRLNVAANVTMPPLATIVSGSRFGRPPVLLGFPRALFDIVSGSPRPRLLPGDSLPGGAFFSGASFAYEDFAGHVYFISNSALHRLPPAAGVETLMPASLPAEAGVTLTGLSSAVLAINDRGEAVVDSNTNSSHRRLYIRASDGLLTLLAYNAALPRWETPSPSGGVITGWTQVAIDELGRVMAFLNVRGGSSGYFLYANGRWQATALNGAQVAGRPVIAGSSGLRAAGDRFYVNFSFGASLSGLAEFREQSWTPLVFPGATLPTGDTLDAVRIFDVNRRGELAFSAVTIGGGGRELTVVRSGNSSRLVHRNDQVIVGGTYLLRVWEIDLRDDGYLYFAGWTTNDRYVLYSAEPLFPLPPRSRHQ